VFRERTWPQILDHDVGRVGEREKGITPFVSRDVEDDASFPSPATKMTDRYVVCAALL
jgi:hypothetical protein